MRFLTLPRRTATLISVGALLASGLTVAALASPTQALNDRCSQLRGAVAGAGDNFEALCLPDEQLAALDDSGADLAVGESAGTDNIKLLANLPKQAPFDAETSYNSDLAFQATTPMPVTTTASRSTTSASRRSPRSPRRCSAPGPRTTSRSWRPALPLHRLPSHRRLLRQHVVHGRDELLGRGEDL